MNGGRWVLPEPGLTLGIGKDEDGDGEEDKFPIHNAYDLARYASGHGSQWKDAEVNDLLGKKLDVAVVPRPGDPFGKCVYCVDHHTAWGNAAAEYRQNSLYTVLNIIDVNLADREKDIIVYNSDKNDNGEWKTEGHNISEEDKKNQVKAVLGLTVLTQKLQEAQEENNYNKLSNYQNCLINYFAMKCCFGNLKAFNIAENFDQESLNDGDANSIYTTEILPEVENIMATGLHGENVFQNKTDTTKLQIKEENGKTLIGPYQIAKSEGIDVTEITVNGINAEIQSEDGKIQDMKEFYIVVDKDMASIGEITNINIKSSTTITSYNSRIVLLGACKDQNLIVWNSEKTENEVELDLPIPPQSFQIEKVDEEGNPLANIGFKIYNEEQNKWLTFDENKNVTSVEATFDEASELTTNEEGKTDIIRNLPYGNYRVVETSLGENNDYYSLDVLDESFENDVGKAGTYKEGWNFSVPGETTSMQVKQIVNTMDVANYYIEKVDADRPELKLEGVQFKIYQTKDAKGEQTGKWVSADDNNDVTELVNGIDNATTLTTDENGRTETLKKLPFGTYDIYETDLGDNEGYEPLTESYEFEYTDPETEQIITETMSNVKKIETKEISKDTVEKGEDNIYSAYSNLTNKFVGASLSIKKVDKETQKPLKDIHFIIYQLFSTEDNMYTNNEGKKIKGKWLTFDIDKENKTANVKDYEKGIRDRGEEDASNATELVTDSEGNVPKITKLPQGLYIIYELDRDNDGYDPEKYGKLDDIEINGYTLKAAKAVTGENIEVISENIVVTNSGIIRVKDDVDLNIDIKAENEPRYGYYITKTDRETSEPLKGIGFKIAKEEKDEEGNEVLKWLKLNDETEDENQKYKYQDTERFFEDATEIYTDEDGNTPVITNLPAGKYQAYEFDLGDYESYYTLDEEIDGTPVQSFEKIVIGDDEEPYVELKQAAHQDIKNTIHGYYLYKQDADDTSEKLNGIGFKIYQVSKELSDGTQEKTGRWIKLKNNQIVDGYTENSDDASELITGTEYFDIKALIKGEKKDPLKRDGRTPTIYKLEKGIYEVYESYLPKMYKDVYSIDEDIMKNKKATFTITEPKDDVTTTESKEEESKGIVMGIVTNTKISKPKVNISGKVWEEELNGKNEKVINNEYDEKDKKIKGIPVQLINKKNNIVVQATTTDENGNYEFKEVIAEELGNYYVQFVYCGITYQSVSQTSTSSDENKSKASENIALKITRIKDRKNLNDAFEQLTGEGQEISYSRITGLNQGDTVGHEDVAIKLSYKSYEAEENGAKVRKVKIDEMFNRDEHIEDDGYIDYSGDNKSEFIVNSTTPEDYLLNRYNSGDTEEITNVNLGLYVRDIPDLSLNTSVQEADVRIGNTTWNYVDGRNNGDWSITKTGVQFEKENPKTDESQFKVAVPPDSESEVNINSLKVDVTYVIALTNNSENLYSKVNKIKEVWSKDLEWKDFGIYNYNENRKEITIYYNYMQIIENGDYKEYTFSLNNMPVIGPGQTQWLYITFEIDKDKVYDAINNNTIFRNYAEIESYSVYSDSKKTPYAHFDRDSIPNNMNVPNMIEDDEDFAPGLKLEEKIEHDEPVNPDRWGYGEPNKISGCVFEDEPIQSNLDANKRIGDGKYDVFKESLVTNVEVSLINAENNQLVEGPVKTNGDGYYSFTDVGPGRYKVQFRWGEGVGTHVNETKITVDSYKSTIVPEYHDNWLTETVRNSDAVDDWNTRVKLDENNTSLNTLLDSKSYENIENMDNTATMTATTEEIEVKASYYDDDGNLIKPDPISNVDFGLIERPKQSMDIDKQIQSLQVTAISGELLAQLQRNDENELEIADTANPVIPIDEGIDKGIWIQMDKEKMSGSNAKVVYKITLRNTSEIDYDSEDYYKYGKEPTTEEDKKEKIVKLKATGIYDYLSGLKATMEENGDWEKVTSTDSISTISQTIDKDVWFSDSSSTSWYETKFDDEVGEEITKFTEETMGEEYKECVINYIETVGMQSSESANLLKDALVKNSNSIYKFKEVELEPGKKQEISYSGETKLVSSDDPDYEIRFDNTVEVEDVETTTNIGRNVELERSKFLDTSGYVTITPPTGENKDYMTVTIIIISAISILGVGIILIKKFVL